MPKGDRWEIVGGAETGGLKVKAGKSHKSDLLLDLLCKGAIVEELSLEETKDGQRLQYSLISGSGPNTGWISVKGKTGNPLASLCSGGKKAAAPSGSLSEKQEQKAAEFEAKTQRELAKERCDKERKQKVISWTPVDINHVNANHHKKAPGMFYGVEFPWNEDMLVEMGPKWLTKAFQAAGTLPLWNSITGIVNFKRHAFGNNGGKTLFEVTYKRPTKNLHTKFFAKYPFDMNDKKQQSDSIAQRVYKQPQDFTEINFYRICEDYIPFKTPKFYYGDISNESTNFIMITEQVNFNDPGPPATLAPFQIEGPYDKAMDYLLRGSQHLYYYLLAAKGATMAGMYKAGKLAPESILDQFQNSAKNPIEHSGIQPGVSGDPMFKAKLKGGEALMFEVAPKVFPEEAINDNFRKKWHDTMLTSNAWQAESTWFRHSELKDYVVFTHQNLNVDNAFFWCDEEGQLDCGIFDWGNIKAMGMGHMFYWWIYTSEWEMMNEHHLPLIDFVIEKFQEEGGPRLDKDTFYKMFVLTAIEHQCEVIKAVPLLYKMVNKKEFETIKSRKDDRIYKTVDGKSTNRVYLHIWNNVTRMLLQWGIDKVLQDFAEEKGSILGWKKDINSIYPG